MMVPSSNVNAPKRGAFIVLEGIDRCGKTTQCALLVKHLLSLSIAALAIRFPDRTTAVGKVIDAYLKSSPVLTDGKKGAVDDRAIHLLFSANRWEAIPSILETLGQGINIVCDRYAYSGVAFSSAKAKEDMDASTAAAVRAMGRVGEEEGLDLEWCMAPDKGLPAPDCVIFLNLSQDESEKRGGYGGERYEKRELQLRVRKRFQELQEWDEKWQRVPWHIVDASQSVEKVQEDINTIVDQTLQFVAEGKPLSRMFEEGVYELSSDLKNTDECK